VLPGQASAQRIFAGAGISVPTGDYGEYADPGYLAEVGVSFPINENGLFVFVDGMYGSNGHADDSFGYESGAKTNLLVGLGGVELSFAAEGEAGPFVFGEVGFMQHKYKTDDYDDSETGFAFGGGAGYGIPLNESINGWVLGRYLQGSFDSEGGESASTGLFAVMAGVSFSVGGG
jgi:hypothetical protein